MCGREIVRGIRQWQDELDAEIDRLGRDWERLRRCQQDVLLASSRVSGLLAAVGFAAGQLAGAEDEMLREEVRRGQA